MNKELFEVLKKMKNELLHKQGITLNKNELRMILRYINDLEIEIAGGDDN